MHLDRVTIPGNRLPDTDRYPFGLPLVRETRELVFRSPLTVFVGENGSGKSTLLRAIARACGVHIWANPDQGRADNNPWEHRLFEFVEPGWTAGHVPGDFFSSEHFRYYSQCLDNWASCDAGLLDWYGGHSLLTLSHGQSVLQHFRTRYLVPGIYFLDEPETALSPRRQLELVEVLAATAAAGHAQFLVATHSPIVMATPGAEILSFDRLPLAPVSWEDTEHCRVYREFFGATPDP